MNKKFATIALSLVVVAVMAAPVYAGKNEKGNGAPSGQHYNLILKGVSKEKSADMKGSNGHVIFVNLKGRTDIQLVKNEESKSIKDIRVLDANGTDKDGAALMLPNPDEDNDGVTAYSVWARATGKPGGQSTTTTCAYDADDALWCSDKSMILIREKGKSSFTNVSKELLYIFADLDDDGRSERYPLFSDALEGYFWSINPNDGLRTVQLRFYEIPTDVNE